VNTLRWSVAALTLIAVSAAVALLLAPKRGAERRGGLLRSTAKGGLTVGGRVTKVLGSAGRGLLEDKPLVGGARADDLADLLAQSQDMVAEGGPADA
jgi:hypothetical protein